MFDLTGRVAVVTGGTGALGAAFARGLAQAGAHVAILARRAEPLAALTAELRGAGAHALGLQADVLDKSQLRAAAEQILAHFGHVDILVNAAGGNQPQATVTPDERTFFDLPEEALTFVFNLNWLGSLLAAQIFGRYMAAQGSGAIINLSSMAAFRPLTRVVAYASAKAALNNFTQWLAVYMAREHSPNIRVNAIAPGFFLGEQNRFLLIDAERGTLTERGAQIIAHTPMARFGTPDDLIGTLIWLASDASRFVTGIVVPVDGGFSAYSGV
ncbi:MAG: D-mannonate oxidoreductase [Candidatus Thermofonsia Clade 1 bacterium]|jgi:NAD(P)-dependent dehydrogenase (short-subunit alcohol dehydrogenase family)|uniref:D-mannonate oxidoreductase n=3 Tax=Candidatus Thermofonsia Clade 1 bacterium TaxID=2364210 RepID=A0A2M8PDF5_9CHLR|nr:MAG: D-mannonate oxidoreductase [Candidatus Thermofonsia Clade 1 bacterium]RMF52087.1 MAG: SDR family NAD(P)-dependent oxidoreductase [Chloroflexota bacterium]